MDNIEWNVVDDDTQIATDEKIHWKKNIKTKSFFQNKK